MLRVPVTCDPITIYPPPGPSSDGLTVPTLHSQIGQFHSAITELTATNLDTSMLYTTRFEYTNPNIK
jgi:hypothetical protein